MEVETIIKYTTYAFCFVIIISAIWSAIYIFRSKNSGLITQRKKWIEQLPSLVSSLGVLGTFAGIAIGLSSFNTNDIDGSIPQLLEGLKTAFYTSLCGMTGSIILSRIANVVLDDSEFAENQEDKSATKIVEAINLLQAALTQANNATTNNIKTNVSNSLTTIVQSLNQMRDDIEELKGHAEEMKDELKNSNESFSCRLGQISSICSTATASISKIDNAIQKLEESNNDYSSFKEEVIENIESIKNSIERHG